VITVCHPIDDIEQILLVAELENAGIPYFINAQHFGSLYPGMQVPWYNERAIRVPHSCYEDAMDVINCFRAGYLPQSASLDSTSKFRMLCEAVLFSWVFPYGNRKDGFKKQ
jgi:hypothetical protein